MKKLFIVIVCLLGVVLSAHNAVKPPKSTITTIVIDAGHGGKDPGNLGGEGIIEKDIALKVALKLGAMIEANMPDVKVIYTRKTDVFIELWERPAIANKNNADLFISIHCNAHHKHEAQGSETYAMGLHKTEGNLDVAKRENSSILLEEDYEENDNYAGFDPKSPEAHIIFSLFQNMNLTQSLGLAENIEANFKALTKLKSRGVKQAGFLVLWKTTMPSVLVELGFLTNKEDRDYLKSEGGQRNSALSIYRAIKTYKENYEKE